MPRVKYCTWVGITDHHQRRPMARATRLPASGSASHRTPAGASRPADAVERGAGVGQVLDHVAQARRRSGRGARRRAAQSPIARRGPAGRGRRPRRTRSARPRRSPAALARLGEQEADPAAEVEEPSRPPVALDSLQRAASCGALARLLDHVVLGGGVGVGAGELGLGGNGSQLHVPAVEAADDVAERGAEAIGGRNQALPTGIATDGEVRLEAVAAAGDAGPGLAPGPCFVVFGRRRHAREATRTLLGPPRLGSCAAG